MKECKYCRTTYDDNLGACPNCGGTKIVTAQEKAEDAALYRKEIENRENAVAAVATKRKTLISVWVGIVVLVIAVIAIASYNANKPLSNGMTKDEGEAVLAEGITFYNAKDYESAIECFLQLPSDSKQYDKAQSMLTKCEDEYSASVVEKANGYAENGEYEMAINLLNNAGDLLPNSAAISTAYDTIFAEYKGIICNNAYSEGETFAANGDYSSAITAIDNATELIGHDDELAAKRGVYVDAYVSQTVSAAKAQYIEYDYESIIAAEGILEVALKILPGNETLLAELSSYQKKEPVKIIEMPATDTEYFYTSGQFSLIGNVEDCNGQEQMDTAKVELFAFDAHDDDYKWWWYCYKTIDIDFQYSKITGTLFQNPQYSGASTTTKIEICGYKEENHYYETVIKDVSINGQSNPIVNFEVDVTGRKYIRIIFKGDYAVGSEDNPYEYAYVSELYLWK